MLSYSLPPSIVFMTRWYLHSLKKLGWLGSLKETVEKQRSSVKKLFREESIKGSDTVLRGSVRAPEGFFSVKPMAAKPRGRSPQGFAA